MRKLALYIGLGILLLTGCRTSEANYRSAYEKAIAGRDSSLAVDSTIYGKYRRQMNARTIELPDGRACEVITQRVRLTDDGGGSAESLHRYSVVVARFKQLFNAKSMRNRLANADYPGAFIVQTGEPMYYVVISSHTTASEADSALRAIPEGKIAMKDPLPFILDATRRH